LRGKIVNVNQLNTDPIKNSTTLVKDLVENYASKVVGGSGSDGFFVKSGNVEVPNMINLAKALSVSNVETVIVFRSCTPVAISVLEYFFMNREFPSLRSGLSLLIVAVGAILYCLSDSQLSMNGISSYYWVMTYYFLILLEMTVGKEVTSSVKMTSIWGPVLYYNFLSIVPMYFLAQVQGDFNGIIHKFEIMPLNGYFCLSFSCVVGTVIGL
jgi:drug/metabolite transporter (DMT)-like permease